MRAVLTRGPGAPEIAIDIRRDNLDKRSTKDLDGDLAPDAAEILDGWVDPDGQPYYFNYEHLTATYRQPPASIGFKIANRAPTDGSGVKQTFIDVWGGAQGRRLDLDTNFGSLNGLDAHVEPIAAGTESDPGVRVCVVGISCVPEGDTSANSGQFGISVHSKVPLFADVEVKTGKTYDFFGKIERVLKVAVEANHSGVDSSLVYLDTENTPVNAQFQIIDDGDLLTYIYAPPNTRALRRHVEIEVDSVNHARNTGQLLCPTGFVAETWAVVEYLSVSDDVCTTSVLTGMSTADSPGGIATETITLRPGESKIVDFWGWSMVPGTTDPVTGAFLEGSIPLFQSPGITYSGWEWLAPNHIRARVTVAPDTAPRGYDVAVLNPDIGDNTTASTDGPALCNCQVIVT
jgi:hypothetical protein